MRAGHPPLLEPLGSGQHSCIPSAEPATIGPRCISSACLCTGSCLPANGAWPSVQIPALTHPTHHRITTRQPGRPSAREEQTESTAAPSPLEWHSSLFSCPTRAIFALILFPGSGRGAPSAWHGPVSLQLLFVSPSVSALTHTFHPTASITFLCHDSQIVLSSLAFSP